MRDSIFFAETSLRSGYPLRMLSSQSGELSFMRMYGQRAQVLGSIIIDGGSGYCKFGWSKVYRLLRRPFVKPLQTAAENLQVKKRWFRVSKDC
ncbi:unnamed protein product [Microthlaspi erraticum]|uniref:Uncharacterized protein n=1 Tax=Microthlaspi erraticum TaxID=1685480 RepID=A0A6D2HJJ6_9BRAS|nr:unnamed protein product [Microthlaspi erraticum]